MRIRSPRCVRGTSPRALLAATCLLAALVGTATPAVGQISESRRTPVVRAVQGARDSVVNIHGQKMLNSPEDPLFRAEGPRKVNGMGTGVIIDERGYIITNFHVVDGVKKIEVTLANGETHIAQLVSTEPATDLAIIKISTRDKQPVIRIGTSHDLLVGESVIALGNAYGYEHTATEGIISALHRSVQVSDTQNYDDLIQTSASINPGNSGGPLLNIDGEMIAINVAVRAGAQGIGFAIPVDKAMHVAAKLLSAERVERKWHGVRASDSPGKHDGVVVTAIDDESPAAKSGIRPGDVITGVGEAKVAWAADFERAFLGKPTGEAVEVTVRRNNKPVKLQVELAAAPQRTLSPSDAAWEMLGLKLQSIPATQFKAYQSRYRGGLTVQSVRPDSPAAKQGIRRGDVLVGMHIWETITQENVEYVLNRPDFADLDPVKFYILRGSETLYGHMPVSLRR